jgi:hypothetical protein
VAQHVGRTRQQGGKKTGQDGRQGGRVGVGQHGGRTPTTRGQRRTGAPEAVGISQGTQHNEPHKVRLAVAPMSRVHDKADKRVSGK